MAELAIVYSPAVEKTWLHQILNVLKPLNQTCISVSSEALMQLDKLRYSHLLFLCDLNIIGRDNGIDELLIHWKQQSEVNQLKGVTIAMLVKSNTVFHTKTYARELAWQLNGMGARIIGRPLVELLPFYDNLSTWQKKMDLPKETLYASLVLDLSKRLINTKPLRYKHPKVIVLHSSDEKTSNTLGLWRLIGKAIEKQSAKIDFKEVHIKRGSVTDCIGCPYEVCTSEAKELSCVLGGQFVEEVMPSIAAADVLIWLCPNYNDTIGGDLIALINRMSGLYRTRDLSYKKVYGIVVSGNSGSDTVANQLIGSLVLNKGFQLPPHFCLSEIAAEPLSLLKKAGIDEKVTKFVDEFILENCE